ncbi:DUF4037 domain-containing protein [Bacillus sp. Marseille-Q1617]|uniref:DUF4037 domain-containing protein n=1 Tax=Bacillus sp. Marseille-Q1617 TaxID=2736887 RepID=UPI0020CA934F|nr:DUF4037 domain-containing protein [Bacillus sp. Marseille-Q1617]
MMDNLKQKSLEMAQLYKNNPKVESILLAGSVSRNWQDEHSDIELHIFWGEPPTDEDRLEPIKKVSGSILSFHSYEEEEWSEAYLTNDGVKLEISSFLTTTVERFIDDVVRSFETSYDKQCIASSIHYGESLYGEVKIKELKNSLHKYPVELSKAMILENLQFGSRWDNRQALLNRKDWLMLYSVICEVQRKLFGILFGLNNMFVHHPSFKWMHHSIALMNVKPNKLDERITDILSGKPENNVKELTQLIEETVFLVEERFPELISSELRRKLSYMK